MHSLPMPINPVEDNMENPGRDSGLATMDAGASVDPHNSVDDYNRVMLQYTQRQMAAFTEAENRAGRRSNSSNSRGSGSSHSSGQSNSSSVTNMAGTGTAPPPQQSARASSHAQSMGGRP